ncbi:helix-turn-helix domain-containing protein [Tropicibacter sp. R16_0]|uniref:GlxA family transcriptional regulator n=1 Tax=Tropicibacter sp. R16_0 TaxID=2821102 RepID=UPI001ADBE34E|nr:helix-turn-helix domain-containing protein [Tropicibacter sp. R16_0]MBO9452903.1 helix-turn-helix domain-containing protein [Tropicibacter sp. R16_0]
MGRPEKDIGLVLSELVEVNRFIFIVMPGFSALELGSGIDSLATANEALGKTFFRWLTTSETGENVESSAGLTVAVDCDLPEIRRGDCIVVCCAFNSQQYPKSGKTAAWLRQAARLGARFCGLGGGALLLARLGLANEGRISAHWRLKPVFEEGYLDLEPTCTIFEEAPNFVSCGGGAATLDLFSALIRQKTGPKVSGQVADQLLCGSMRDGDCRQSLSSLYNPKHRNEKLSKAIDVMQETWEEPVSPSEIARQVGISTRQLERLFSRHLGMSPKTYMMVIKLERARALLQQTQMRVIDVATACGFSTQNMFSKHYRRHFGISPREEKVVLAH